MPFRSQAQWRWAFATGQEFADEWAKLTPGGKRRYELLRRRVQKKQSLKHLPGKHDQRKHGRNGGGSSGGASSGGVSEKPLAELSTDELITLLDDPSQYDSEAYAVSKAGVDLVRELLDKGDNQSKQFIESLGLDINDPDTPRIVAGLCSVIKMPGENNSLQLMFLNGWGSKVIYQSAENENAPPSKSNKGVYADSRYDIINGVLEIQNSSFYNTSDIRGLGYTVRRQQALAAQLYKRKTGRDVRINAEAVSDGNTLNGAHTWPYLGYNFDFNKAFSNHMRNYGFDADDSYSLFKQRNTDGKTGADMYRTMLNDWVEPGIQFGIFGRLYATEPQGLDGLEILVGYGRKKYGSKTKAYMEDVNMNNSDLDDTDIAILIDLWNAKVPPKKLTRREKALVRLKHLPGKHDQRKHGRDGGGGSSVGGNGTTVISSQQQIDDYYEQYQELLQSDDWQYSNSFNEALITLSKPLSEMDEATQMTLATNPDIDSYTATTLMLYGEPTVRETLAHTMHKYNTDLVTRINNGEIIQMSLMSYQKPFDVRGAVRTSSLEYMEIDNKHLSTVELLWRTHAFAENGLATAQLQQIWSVVGPNADVSRTQVRSFFPGDVTPKPNPRYVKIMQDEYEKTQNELAARGITEITLYRSSPYDPGISLEPWTPIRSVATKFGNLYKKYTGVPVTQRKAKIPAKYMLATWETASWWDDDSVMGKSEHMVAGLAYAHDTGTLL